MRTVRSLIDRGLLYEDDGLIGLSPAGVCAWIEIPPGVKIAAL